MCRARAWVLAILAVGLFHGSSVWADSTLGTGNGRNPEKASNPGVFSLRDLNDVKPARQEQVGVTHTSWDFDERTEGLAGLWSNGYRVYVFSLGTRMGGERFVDRDTPSIPLGTFGLEPGAQGNGKIHESPVTGAGLTIGSTTVPEPGTLALVGAGLLSMAGILRRLIKSQSH